MTMDPNTKDEAFIRTEDVTFSYGDTVPDDVLKGIVMHVEKGEFVALLGHNGSGKSTLIQTLNGLLRPTSGQVLLDGKDIWEEPTKIRAVRFRVGMVVQ